MAFCDRNCNVIEPFVSTPGNRNESPLLKAALPQVTRSTKQVDLDLNQTMVSLDGVYDSRSNRKAIFNRGMVPNISENRRGRKTPKRGRKPMFNPAIFQERFYTVSRQSDWQVGRHLTPDSLLPFSDRYVGNMTYFHCRITLFAGYELRRSHTNRNPTVFLRSSGNCPIFIALRQAAGNDCHEPPRIGCSRK